MRKLLSLVITIAVLLSIPFASAEGDDILITIGKQYNKNSTIMEGHSVDNNYFLDYIYEKDHIKVDYAWVLDDDSQKAALAVANGEIPDVMIVDLDTYNMLLESDMLAPLNDAFEEGAGEYLNAARFFYKEAFAAASVGDKLMAIPNTTLKGAHSMTWVRRDWLANVGIEIGDTLTLDEIVTIAEAFVTQDPDGNGIDDTIGLPMDPSIVMGGYQRNYDFSRIANLMGAYPRTWFLDEEGTVHYGSVEKETRDVLEYLAQLYERGLIDRQFAVRDQSELVISGKCGILFAPWTGGDVRNSHGYDGADWIPVVGPVDEMGNFYIVGPEPCQYYTVVSKYCEHPEAIIRIIEDEYCFWTYLTGDSKWDELNSQYQTLGVGWTVMPIAIEICNNDVLGQRGIDMKQMVETNGDRTGVSLANQAFYDAWLQYCEDHTFLTGWMRYVGMYLGNNLASFYEKNVIIDPCFWGTTKTMKDKWVNLKTMEDELYVKVIMNEVGIEAYDEFVERWYAEGGTDIVNEVQKLMDCK